MTDYSELIRKARAVPGPTLLMTYPAQTTPDPLSNALADAIEAQAKRVAELESALRNLDLYLILDSDKDTDTLPVLIGHIRAARAALEKK